MCGGGGWWEWCCGLWLQRQEGNSHGNGKLNICKHTFVVPSLTMGHGEDLIKGVLWGPSLSVTLVHIKLWLCMVILPSLEQGLYLNVFRLLGEDQRFVPSLWFLENNQLEIINIPNDIFWDGKFWSLSSSGRVAGAQWKWGSWEKQFWGSWYDKTDFRQVELDVGGEKEGGRAPWACLEFRQGGTGLDLAPDVRCWELPWWPQ